MKILIYCCSVYQLFNGIHLRMHLHPEDEVDVMLSDILPGQEKLAEGLRRSGLFGKVITSQGKFIARQQYRHTRWTIYGYRIFPSILLKQVGVCLEDAYDRFYFGTFDEYVSYLFLRLHWLNKNLEAFCFEDGGYTYMHTYQSCNVIEERLYRWLGILPLGKAKVPLLVYEPDLMTFDCGAPVLKMPSIDLEDAAFREAVNTVFDFSSASLPECEAIFFEESFLADGLENNDAELIELCNRLCGGNMLLKPHPRNPYNRFEKSGIRILHSKIPWEVFCLNVDLTGKKLITINSNSAISPHILLGTKAQTILLFNMLKGKSALHGNVEAAMYYQKLLQIFSGEIVAPANAEELGLLLEKH